MSDEKGKPEEELSEQAEAFLADQLNKLQAFQARNRTFLARKELRETFVDLGMPERVANILVGRMSVLVVPEAIGGGVYDQLLSQTAQNIFELWKLYSQEVSEDTFLEVCRTYSFHPPALRKRGESEASE